MGQGGTNMIDVTDANYWNERFEERNKEQKIKNNKALTVGLVLFGIFTAINAGLICAFFNLLGAL